MATLQEILARQIPALRDEIKELVKTDGHRVISEVTVKQAYGGMRGVKGLVCDTSFVDPQEGLIIRDYPLLEIQDLTPEEGFFLLLTGERPDKDAVQALQDDFDKRAGVPDYVWKVLEAMPEDSHPMCMFDTGILVMQRESVFAKAYAEGIRKSEYWQPVLEDALTLLARLPELAAGVYRLRYKKGPRIAHTPGLDWGANCAKMLGVTDDPTFAELIRLYLLFHNDHEGGNVSSFSCHTVASALSDAYYSVSAGLNGLAGPLHGLANQNCLKWVLALMEEFGDMPTKEQLARKTQALVDAGQVIPGYGHAVLRATDPRFTGLLEFGKKHFPDDPVFRIVALLFEVVPPILGEIKKISDPWPNVDASSGAVLYHYGMTEFEYYTVLFAVSRAQGMLAQMIVNRALASPITRPKSVTTDWIKNQVAAKA
ncbi:MAG: citrate (Si)-synthase [Verrucomicrobia bacterium]|nr:citrate (Si)-synthase [Verrucomicrobiota bacterium]